MVIHPFHFVPTTNLYFPVEEFRELCKFFEDHPVRGCKNDICRAGLEAIGYPLSKQNSKLLKTSQKVLEKRTYKYISRDYDF